MTIGLEHVRAPHRQHRARHRRADRSRSLTFAGIVLGLADRCNPLFTGEPVGGAFFNLILLGYGIPAVLAIVLALRTRDCGRTAYRIVAAVTAVAAGAAPICRSRCARSITGRC